MVPQTYTKKQLYRIFGLITLTCFVFYGNIIRNYYSEDDFRVTSDYNRKNPAVEKGFGGLAEIFSSRYTKTKIDETEIIYGYRPMARASMAIEWALWGQNPHLGHLVNILMYSLSCCLLFYLLIKTVFNGRPLIYPLLTTLLFVAHPIHTEVVASLKNREEQLSFIFGLLFIATVWRYFTTRKLALPWVAVFLLILSIISKETGIIYMALAPLFVYFFHPNGKTAMHRGEKINFTVMLVAVILVYSVFIKLDPFAIMTSGFAAVIWINKRPYNTLVAYGLVGSVVILIAMLIPNVLLEQANGGRYFWANPLFGDVTFNQRIGFMLNVFLFNIKLLFYPHPLGFYYGYNVVPLTGIFAPTALFSLAILGVMLFSLFKLFTKNKLIAFAILFFFISLAPFSNLLPVPGIVADRFLYTPSLSFCIGLALILINLKQWLGAKSNSVLYISAGLTGLIYFGKVFTRNQDWYSYYDLYTRDTKYLVNSAKANSMLGRLMFDNIPREKNPNKRKQLIMLAIKHYERAIKIWPAYPDAMNTLGTIYFNIGDYNNALFWYNRNLNTNPDEVASYTNIASCYVSLNNIPKAKYWYNIAIDKDSLSAVTYLSYADIYLAENKSDSADYIYNKAIKRGITDPEIMAISNDIKGNSSVAKHWYNQAISSGSQSPTVYLKLGDIYIVESKPDSAQAVYAKAISKGINQPELMALNYQGIKDLTAAKYWYGIAIKNNTQLPIIYLNFAELYLKENKPDSALYVYSKAQSIGITNPQLSAAINKLKK